MNYSFIINRNLLSIIIPALLFGITILIINSIRISDHALLELAISIDLIITIPAIYLLLIRKTKIPKTTIVPCMVIGLLIGLYFLPERSKTYLSFFKMWALPFVEIAIISYVFIKVRATIRKTKKYNNSSIEFPTLLKLAGAEILPQKLIPFFVTEISVLYYGFINWKSRELNSNEFSYHFNSGTRTLLYVFIFLIGIETIAVHFLLAKWSSIIVWIFSAISIYIALQLFGYAKSLSRRPIIIRDESLILRYGIMNETEISLSDIESIILSKQPINKNNLTTKLSPFGDIESHNIIIQLKNENTLNGIYGVKKKYIVLGFHVDQPTEFKNKLESVMG